MFLVDFEDWISNQHIIADRQLSEDDTRLLFDKFFDENFCISSATQCNNTIKELAYQILHLQVCVEGMLEDINHIQEAFED